MIVTFECDGERCEADVTCEGIDDRDPRARSFGPDYEYKIRWIADCSADQLELDGLAITAFLDARQKKAASK